MSDRASRSASRGREVFVSLSLSLFGSLANRCYSLLAEVVPEICVHLQSLENRPSTILDQTTSLLLVVENLDRK